MDKELETERLFLRLWRHDDLEQLAQVFAKEPVWRYPFKRGWTREETRDFLSRKIDEWQLRGFSQWAVEVKAETQLIGFLGLAPPEFLPEVVPTVEVGWRLDPAWWGRGLATEGGRAALEYGFKTLGLEEIVSIYEPENLSSERVMERLGMKRFTDTTHPSLGVPLRVYKLTSSEWVSR
ncbi:MAG TPA: GNAT family N-acetyltransferase [Acidimicrobiales bacterium]|nr:GNAT family N-acetyltransferase [Acidimicrobiales bacterium]